MSSLLHELGNDSLLLMYLADELPAGDRAEVERRLLADPAMRVELDRLREAQETVATAIASLDAAPPAQEEAAVRSASRAVRQWQASRVAAAPAQPARAARHFPRWAIPAAVAAAVAAIAVAVAVRMNNPRPADAPLARGADPVAEYAIESFRQWENGTPEEGTEVASVSYDQPLFDIPLAVPPEGGQPEP